jgi:hypothetical protein
MFASSGHGGGRSVKRGGSARRSLRIVLLVAVLAVIAALASGCGGSSSGTAKGVASVAPTAGSTPAAQSSGSGKPPSRAEAKAAALAYSKCMRAHGVTAFPDPDSNGGIALSGDTVNQNSPTFKSANTACQSLIGAPPAGGGGAPQDKAAALKYSACMRQHGVTKFPDPNAGGGLDIDASQLGMDPNSPTFKSADQTCQHFMSQGKSGQPGTNGG